MNIIDRNLNFGTMNMTNNPNMLIVHHLEAEGANRTVEAIHNMHKNENGWAGIGYHYYIRLDGTVYEGRPDNAIGAHCQGRNTNTLGGFFEGNYDTRTIMPTAQYNSWYELKAYLCNKYGNMLVYGHREKGSSECPWKNFPLDSVKNASSTSSKYGWTKDSTGWWYKNQDGSYPKDCWLKLDSWYSFDSQGYARCNTWIQDQGKWYWLKSDCRMACSETSNINGKEYKFNDEGEMI